MSKTDDGFILVSRYEEAVESKETTDKKSKVKEPSKETKKEEPSKETKKE